MSENNIKITIERPGQEPTTFLVCDVTVTQQRSVWTRWDPGSLDAPAEMIPDPHSRVHITGYRWSKANAKKLAEMKAKVGQIKELK